MDRRSGYILGTIIILIIVGTVLVLYASRASNQSAATSTVFPQITAIPNTTTQNAITAEKQKVQHIIVIVQENHAFDNYFGTFPGAVGIPQSECMPRNITNSKTGCVKPFLTTDPTFPINYSNNTNGDILCHSYQCSIVSYDIGKMDGFVQASNTSLAMAYFNNQTIPYYWNLARNYTLDDMFFQSVLGYSLPNHWYAVAGQAPVESVFYINLQDLINSQYITDAANVTTIADVLDKNRSVSWKYYDFPLYVPFNVSTVKYNFWNPFAAQARNYQQINQSHFVVRGQIFTDIKDHELPNVSYVIPASALSEHPPYNVTYGMYWSSSVIDAVMNSSYWNNTVVVLVWDDYGGYFDTVKPPHIASFGYGPRVAAMVISPYSKHGKIDNTTYAFESILKFIEWRYNIQPLTNRDRNANSIMNSLDFNQSPSRPYVPPVTPAQRKLIQPYINETPTED